MVNFYKLVFRTLFICSLLTFFTAVTSVKSIAQLSGSYTIDKNSPASSTNYVSFQSFFTDLSSLGVNGAVTASVLNGPYTEQVTAAAISGVSATNTITINGNNQVLQFTATASATRHTLLFNGADRVTINNLDIRGNGTTYAFVVRLANLSEYITLDGCKITTPSLSSSSTANTALITASGSATSTTTTGNNVRNFTVKNCTLSGGTSVGPGYGIIIYESGTATDNIKIHNNVYNNIYYMYNRFYYVDGMEFFDNELKRTTGFTGITTTYGMYTNQCGVMYIRRNRLHDLFPTLNSNVLYGILLTSNPRTSGSDISNNMIYNNMTTSTIYNLYNASSPGVDIVYNTISCDNQTYSYNGTVYALYHTGTASGQIRNNIISITNPGGGTRIGLYHSGGVSTVNNNNVYITGTGTNYYGYSSSGYSSSLTAWRSATGSGAPFGQNDVDVNPMLTNPLVGNLTPRSIAVDGIGAPVGITTDITGAPRDVSNPDPGAIEFDIPANVTRIILGGPNNCQMQKETVKAWVKNNSSIVISGFSMAYRVNGGTPVVEPFVGSLNPGDSVQFTFTTQNTYTLPGSFSYEARIVGKPYVGPNVVNVNAAPLGAEVVKGATFNGQFNAGGLGDPDIVANPDQIIYDLKPPTGYSNAGFGTTWYISKLVAKTVGGANINSADTSTSIATASQNVRIRFTPSASYTDSFIKFTTTVYSLTTNCFAPDIERIVFVAPRPKAGADVVDLCDGDQGVFASTSTISSGRISYDWDFGDGTTSIYADNNKQYATYGTYNVKLTVTSNYGYTDVITKTVNIWRKPEVAFSVTNKCVGQAVPFTDNTIVYNGSGAYNWKFGDNTGTSAAPNPNYTYSTPGSYMTTLTVTDAKGCFASITKPVTYSAKPIADFTVPSVVCNQTSVVFTNTSIPVGFTGYEWKFGDGTSANGESAMHSYTNAGTYPVTIIARNEFSCVDSITKSVTLNEAPKVDFTSNTKCMGEPVAFTNTTTEPAGSTVNYSWMFGDGGQSSNKNDAHTYNRVGDFDVILMAQASNGCNSEKKDMISVREKPIADFSLPQTACTNNVVNFANGSSSTSTLSYDWDFGDGNKSTVANPANTFATKGSYTVVLVATAAQGCTHSVSRSITVSETPNSGFIYESGKTGNGRIIFTPQIAGGSGEYKWAYGDGSIGNSKVQHDYTYFGLGIFNVTLKITDNGCTSSTSKEIVLNTMGVEDVAGLGVIVYPNPSTGNVTVDFGTQMTENATVTVMNITGQVMQQYTAANAVNGQVAVNLSEAAAGIYLVQIQKDGQIATQKVTITR